MTQVSGLKVGRYKNGTTENYVLTGMVNGSSVSWAIPDKKTYDMIVESDTKPESVVVIDKITSGSRLPDAPVGVVYTSSLGSSSVERSFFDGAAQTTPLKAAATAIPKSLQDSSPSLSADLTKAGLKQGMVVSYDANGNAVSVGPVQAPKSVLDAYQAASKPYVEQQRKAAAAEALFSAGWSTNPSTNGGITGGAPTVKTTYMSPDGTVKEIKITDYRPSSTKPGDMWYDPQGNLRDYGGGKVQTGIMGGILGTPLKPYDPLSAPNADDTGPWASTGRYGGVSGIALDAVIPGASTTHPGKLIAKGVLEQIASMTKAQWTQGNVDHLNQVNRELMGDHARTITLAELQGATPLAGSARDIERMAGGGVVTQVPGVTPVVNAAPQAQTTAAIAQRYLGDKTFTGTPDSGTTRKRINNPDGSFTITQSNGEVYNYTAQGKEVSGKTENGERNYIIVHYADGTSQVVWSDGTAKSVTSNGKYVQSTIQGGTQTVTNSDGSTTVTFADGTVVRADKFGNVVSGQSTASMNGALTLGGDRQIELDAVSRVMGDAALSDTSRDKLNAAVGLVDGKRGQAASDYLKAKGQLDGTESGLDSWAQGLSGQQLIDAAKAQGVVLTPSEIARAQAQGSPAAPRLTISKDGKSATSPVYVTVGDDGLPSYSYQISSDIKIGPDGKPVVGTVQTIQADAFKNSSGTLIQHEDVVVARGDVFKEEESKNANEGNAAVGAVDFTGINEVVQGGAGVKWAIPTAAVSSEVVPAVNANSKGNVAGAIDAGDLITVNGLKYDVGGYENLLAGKPAQAQQDYKNADGSSGLTNAGNWYNNGLSDAISVNDQKEVLPGATTGQIAGGIAKQLSSLTASQMTKENLALLQEINGEIVGSQNGVKINEQTVQGAGLLSGSPSGQEWINAPIIAPVVDTNNIY